MKNSAHLLVVLAFLAPLHADELSDAFDQLKAAEAANDPAAIKRFALESSRLALAEATQPPPTLDSQQDFWAQRLEYLLQTDIYTEYALAVAAGRPGVAPEQIIDLTDTLIVKNPRSQYLHLAVIPYIGARLATGGEAARTEAAERIVELQPDNEDALVTLADAHMTAQNTGQAAAYAKRLVEALLPKPKPEGFSDADWQSKRNTLLARGYFIAGASACVLESWADCDTNLREARPYVGEDPGLGGHMYFYLGWSNYQLFKNGGDRALLQQAVEFSKQSAAIAGPVQTQAQQNVTAMEQELAR